MNVQLENIPEELKALPQFVTWKYNAKKSKLPCSVANGRVADAHDPASWGCIDQAMEAYQRLKHAGIGFDFTTDDPYTGIDLDNSIGDDGLLKPVAAAIVAAMDTYTEISPSGKGVKLIGRGSIVSAIVPTDIGEGVKVEIYSTLRFFTITGNHYPGTPATIRDISPELATLYARVKPIQPEPDPTVRRLPIAAANADDARRYCLAALEGEHQKMLAAGDGERHWRRYNSAKALGGFVPVLSEQEIFDALAVNFGADRRGAELTLGDGIAAGVEAPRTIPEPKQPTFDADGHACCPAHGDHLIACKTGNGYRCPRPKLGEPLCFYWRGEGYYPPTVSAADVDDLDPETLRRRLRAAIAERDHWRERAERAEMALGQVKEHNRFVTQATAADIASAGKRLTFIDLKKEIDRVPVEEREEGQWVRVRQTAMARATNQNAGTISKHIKEFKAVGWIDTAVRRIKDTESGAWSSETFVRPLVDLNNPTVISLPAKPRGRRTCGKCGSDQLVREVKIRCVMCEHEEVSAPELVNPFEPELQTETQPDQPTEDAATFFEMLPEPVADVLNCNAPCIERTTVSFSELQTAIHTTRPSPAPLIDLDNAPGVLAGKIAPDDPWLAYQREMQAARGVS